MFEIYLDNDEYLTKHIRFKRNYDILKKDLKFPRHITMLLSEIICNIGLSEKKYNVFIKLPLHGKRGFILNYIIRVAKKENVSSHNIEHLNFLKHRIDFDYKYNNGEDVIKLKENFNSYFQTFLKIVLERIKFNKTRLGKLENLYKD